MLFVIPKQHKEYLSKFRGKSYETDFYYYQNNVLWHIKR